MPIVIYTRKDLKKWINNNIVNDKGKINPWSGKQSWWANKGFHDQFQYILSFTSFVTSQNIRERLFCILNDITNLPKCIECDENTTKYHPALKGYSQFCSYKCQGQSKYTNQKRKTTCLERYGTEFNMQSIHCKELSKKTCLEKYGSENPTQSQIVKDKIKATNVKRYGVENVAQSQIVKDKIKETFKENYGGHPFTNKEWLKDRYKDGHHARRHLTTNALTKIDNKEWLIEQHYKFKKPLCQIADELGFKNASLMSIMFQKFDIKVQSFYTSTGEQQLLDFIKSFYSGKILENDRKILRGKELDIYIPEFNLAFEYNGIYWHSELQGIDKNYHLNKTELCEKQGIRLVHIFENEWNEKQGIVKSRIKSILHNNETIYARKCEIKIVNINSTKSFLIDNHIQGSCPSSVNLGLYLQDELVALMTFGKARFNKNIEWELLRFCNKLNTSVIGGASRLYKYFQNNYEPNSVISYSDKRWNKGKLYETLGMVKQKPSPPNYWYFKGQEIVSRIKFQKHKLKQLLNTFNPKLTEWQNMVNNGWNRIWDCGNDVFIIVYK